MNKKQKKGRKKKKCVVGKSSYERKINKENKPIEGKKAKNA